MTRPIDKPLRICVSDVFKGMGSGFSITGKIASGCVQIGDRVLVMPASEYAAVKGMNMHFRTLIRKHYWPKNINHFRSNAPVMKGY